MKIDQDAIEERLSQMPMSALQGSIIITNPQVRVHDFH
jgi:hypothetical protein